MSRSNGPGAPPNGWPADYRPADPQDPYQDPYYTQQQRPAPQPPVSRQPRIQTQAPPSRVPQTGLPQGGLPPQNYGHPQPPQGYPQGYPQGQYAQPPQPQYAPPQQYAQPQRQAQPTRPPQPQGDPRYGAYADYSAPPTGRPTAPNSAYPPAYSPPPPAPAAYVPETTGRPTQPAQQRATAYADQWPPVAPNVDPHGYDLGTYMPQSQPDPRTQRPTAPPAWVPHAEPEPLHRQQQPQQGYQSQFPADLHVPSQALEPVDHDEEYDDQDEYEDAPRKTRYGLIAASLIAAIAVGGGLAYAYKIFVAPTSQMAATPLVKSGTGPIKVKPVDPGGTKFANADSKMMEQLSGSSSSDAGNSDGGPKAVKTLTIERDGTVASAQSDAAPPPQRASGGVPGMIIAGLPPQQSAPVQAAAAPVTVQPPPQRAAPKIIAAAAPPQAASPDDAAAAPLAPAVKKPPAAKKPVPPLAVGGPTGANGFVAVLASVPASATSRVQAMQQYADLQQKFGGVLGSKAPDVVEAKLGDKGTFHRLVVGPPGSRDAAGSVCTQLKAAGYTADCWVTAF